MIFRLEYKNKALKTARVDIITPTGTGVETVEGTGYPFQLKYEGDKKNKGLMFLSSSAEINIYETPLFNIDTLKTSGEKDIRVNYYIDSVLEWTGFVIPDFFSREIGGDGVVSMVASDRLSVLDSEVLEGLPVTVTLRTLLSLSLAKTGLTLPLKTVVDFATVSGNTNVILNHSIRSQRLTDTKGRSVNCKDIIKSILAATNSKLMQRKGEWWVVNKMQHELGAGRVYTSPTAFTNYVEDLISFTDVTRGAMRTIAPVAGGVGVFQEYGGGALAPNNYAFESGLSGWTLHNGFTASTDNRRVLGYTKSGNVYTPIYDLPGTAKPYLVNKNLTPGDAVGLPYVYSMPHARASIPVISANPFSAKIKVEVNATGRGGSNGVMLNGARFLVVLKRPGRDNLVLNRDGQWQAFIGFHGWLLASFTGEELEAVDGSGSLSGTINAAGEEGSEDDINDYSIDLFIFGSGRSLSGDTTVIRDGIVFINSASVQFSAASNDNPKGTLYKADQGGESYTKIHDTETTVFGDYLTGGLNGYFYNYAPNDTSSLLAPNGSRSQPAWVNTFTQNTEPLPLLQQTIRQMRRMFSVAHDFIKGEIDVSDFDPLSIFEDCERRFVIVEAEFDFLRGSLQVVLEEVAYQNLTVREYIYSYFGEGDEGIRGISGISAGSSGGGGGGIAPEPSWLENEITIDSESGLLSVDGWHVKGDLIIEGQVNQWLAQQLVVDDARIQVTWRQGGATVDSGLVIYNKDTSTEVSSLVYDVDGIWRAGGQQIFTDDYNPMLGGYSAASYPRKAEAAVVTGAWKIDNNLLIGGTGTASERLHVAGNGLFAGAVTAGGNVGTSNFASQLQGWRVTPTGIADFRHIYTDELQAKAFTADISQALVGSDVLTKSVAKLAQNWATTANGATSSIYVEELEGFPGYQVFAEGDRLLLRLFDRSGGGLLIKNIWATVANYVSTTNNVQRYLITVNSGGITGHTVYAGSMILDYGTSGSGVIERTVLDAMGSPYSQVKTWVNDPSNPANYTIHNRTGNLDGIANASGFGFYGENTFLTGKLLVGDLTKQGQYMEYENGQLNIRGKITVTGGNAATKEDVDAVQVGGRNLLKLSDYSMVPDKAIFNNVHIKPNTTYTLSDYNGVFERGQVAILDPGGSSLFVIWDWSSTYKKRTFTTPASIIEGDYTIRFWKAGGGNAFEASGRTIKLETGNRATDWTPAPEDVPSAVDYLAKALQDGTTDIEGGLVSTNVLMVKDTNGTVRGGISGLASDNVGFWTGGTYQGAIANNANVIFRKDGSFSLAGGKISGTAAGALSVDGGVVTGMIESQNWDGENGSRLNLLDGSLEFGNTVKIDSFAKEIIVKDGATQNTGVRIGDFLLSPTSGGAGALDVDLSGSNFVYASNGYSLPGNLTRIYGSGVIANGSVNISTSLSAGNNYTFQADIKARITPRAVRRKEYDPNPPLTVKNSFSGGGVSPEITVSLFSGATKVGGQTFAIRPKSDLGDATFFDMSLRINIPFVAASNSLRVDITQSGDVVWKTQHPASGVGLGGDMGLVEFSSVQVTYSELNTSSRVRIVPSAAINELSAKGFLSLWGPEKYFRIYDRAGVTNFIEARGTQEYISPNGNVRLRITDTGIYKKESAGGSWIKL